MVDPAIRPTGEAAYRSTDTVYKPEGFSVELGSEITSSKTLAVDVCVIGSGAGGGPVAKELAEGGASVLILEEGEWQNPDDANAQPGDMVSKLYRDAAQTITLGGVPIGVPQASAVGGTTTINGGTCFRTPDAVLKGWSKELGINQITAEELDPYFRRVERELNVSKVPESIAGPSAQLIRKGAQKLGYKSDFIYRASRGCIGSSICSFGCPSSGKQHVGITFIPKAWSAGAKIYTGCKALKIEHSDGKATAVVAKTCGGGRLTVNCKQVVVSCGTFYTPVLLKRSKVGVDSKWLGRNLSLHPSTVVRGRFDQDINPFDSALQAYFIDEFIDEGIIFEGSPAPLEITAMSLPHLGAEHREQMLAYSNSVQFAPMISDTSRGSVRSLFGMPLVHYRLNRHDLGLFKRGIEILTEVFWAAGAREVTVPLNSVPTLKDGDMKPLRNADFKAKDMSIMAFHPLGTARMSVGIEGGVVDQSLCVHGFENIYVADGSVVPTSLGVNPQITIMALASRLGFKLTERKPPVDEPQPESLPTVHMTRAHH